MVILRKIAIYARQSVTKEDSISIETQIEHCRYSAKGEECIIYQDSGFSGGNTNRPDFQKMIKDIKAKKISKVIVYKLDRMSRSVLDFSKTFDLFKKYDVDFISSTESFDTSTPMGKAMLNISVVFAQLEREQTQQRIIDAYKSRSEKGYFMGGTIPYGYEKAPITIDGINTSTFEPKPEEAENIRLIYELYSKPAFSLNQVIKELAKTGRNVKTTRGNKYWTTARLSETIRNPTYVKADYNIYSFFKEQGCNIINPIEDFDGEHACYLFSDKNTHRKTWDLKGSKIVVAPHKGLIPAEIWLNCRRKLLNNHQIKTTKPKNSFLAGKVKCGLCGYAMVIRKSNTKAGRYFVCQGKSEHHCCKGVGETIYATEFENMIVEKMAEKINSLTIKPLENNKIDEQALTIQKLKSDIIQIKQDIKSLIDKIAEADTNIMKYINERVTEKESKMAELQRQIETLENTSTENKNKIEQLTNVMSLWDKLNFDDKVGVVNLLIKKIDVYPKKAEITWFF